MTKNKLIVVIVIANMLLFSGSYLFGCKKKVDVTTTDQPLGKYTVYTSYRDFYTNHYELIPNTSCVKFNGIQDRSQHERVACGDFTVYQHR